MEFKEKISEESENILDRALKVVEELEEKDKENFIFSGDKVKEKINILAEENNSDISSFRQKVVSLFDEIKDINMKYLNDRNQFLEIDSEQTISSYRVKFFSIVESTAKRNPAILQHMYMVTASYLNTLAYNANLICNYYMKNLSSDIFDNILYVVKLYLVKLIEFNKDKDSDLTKSIMRLLELFEDKVFDSEEIEKLFSIVEETDNIINISNEYNNKEILKGKYQKEPVWTYKDLNNMALEQGYALTRYNGDHAIFTKEGFASIPIPQKTLGKGIGRVIKKLIYSQKKIL